jgi:hypothetical protein
MAWLLAVYVLTAGMFVPLLWQAMGRRLHSEWLRELRFGSVFQVFGSVEDQFRELPLVLLWLAGVGLASLPWALRQVRAFRPPPVPTAPDAIPEPAADLPPPPPSP